MFLITSCWAQQQFSVFFESDQFVLAKKEQQGIMILWQKKE
jgi:hypothetical protein